MNLIVNKDTFHLCNSVKQISCRENSKLSSPTPRPLFKRQYYQITMQFQHIRINYIQSVASATRFFKRTNQNLQSRSAFSCWNACGYSLYATQLRALYTRVLSSQNVIYKSSYHSNAFFTMIEYIRNMISNLKNYKFK